MERTNFFKSNLLSQIVDFANQIEAIHFKIYLSSKSKFPCQIEDRIQARLHGPEDFPGRQASLECNLPDCHIAAVVYR